MTGNRLEDRISGSAFPQKSNRKKRQPSTITQIIVAQTTVQGPASLQIEGGGWYSARLTGNIRDKLGKRPRRTDPNHPRPVGINHCDKAA